MEAFRECPYLFSTNAVSARRYLLWDGELNLTWDVFIARENKRGLFNRSGDDLHARGEQAEKDEERAHGFWKGTGSECCLVTRKGQNTAMSTVMTCAFP